MMPESTRVLRWNEPGALDAAARVLRAGGVAALPTETLYGFSCLAGSDEGLARIVQLKGIAQRRGFVALLGDIALVERELAPEQDPRAVEFLRRVWPAPLTAVLRVGSPLPWGASHAGVHTAAFRVPAHAELLRLLRVLGEPLLSTSINRTGQPPRQRPQEILQEFGAGLDLLVLEDADPERPVHADAKASSLGDFTRWPPRSLRAGPFDLQAAVACSEPV